MWPAATTSRRWWPRSRASVGGPWPSGPTCPTKRRWTTPWPRPREALGTITLVANVAGGSGPGFGLGPLLGVPAAEFRRVLDVNVTGTWLVSKACAGRMVAGRGGRSDMQRLQSGRQAGLPAAGRLLRGQGGGDPAHPDDGHGTGPVGYLRQRRVPRHRRHRSSQRRAGSSNRRSEKPSCATSRSVDSSRPRRSPPSSAWLLSDDAAAITGEAVNASAGQTMV